MDFKRGIDWKENEGNNFIQFSQLYFIWPKGFLLGKVNSHYYCIKNGGGGIVGCKYKSTRIHVGF